MIATLGTLSLLLTGLFSIPMVWVVDNIYARHTYWVICSTFVLSILLLLWALCSDDFSVGYVVENSHPQLPGYLKLSALWAGHAGSLMLMVLSLLFWGVWLYKSGIQTHFSMLIKVIGVLVLALLYLDSPFVYQVIYQRMPKTLNPLLQDIGMMIHPPVLLLGYMGTIIPWLVSYQTQIPSSIIQRQQQLSVAILSLGILLGGWWSYRVLGWGGYWAWDPIEVISLIPWLLQVVILHIKPSDHQLQYVLFYVNAWLMVLCLLLARSDLLNSVHSFAPVSHMSQFFLLLLLMISLMGWFDQRLNRIGLSRLRRCYQKEMLYYAVVLLFSLVLPVFAQMALSATFYHKISVIFLIMLLQKWIRQKIHFYIVVLLTLLLIPVLQWFWSALIIAMSLVAMWQQRHSRMMVALIHMGFLGMIIAICVHISLQRVGVYHLAPEQSIETNSGKSLQYQGAYTLSDQQKETSFIRLLYDQETLFLPNISYYPTRDILISRPDIKSRWGHDLYMAIEEIQPDGHIYVSIGLHDYICYILLSGLVMIYGLLRYRRDYV
ncbi:cytochrome c biogenesis protein CcsA [Gammaproteobacteria bacterium]|nr:cytochrome c biogenesis protein CcsA [Gammaproteobacteria bacterium]